MTERPEDNADQAEFWSTIAGQNWVAHQDAMDALMDPVLQLVLDRAALRPGEHVLDIGCGAGTSTAAAAHLTTGGSATGFDISDTLLARARKRYGDLPGVSFVNADTQTYRFSPTHDALISRFGVMFFADSVAAFANMARALKPGGRIIFAAWGPAPNNPWFMIPARVAAERLGKMPKTDRTLPGPFAFEDQSRVVDILKSAGLMDITAQTHNLYLTPDGGLDEAASLCCRIGPAEKAIRHFNGTLEDRNAIRAGIVSAFGSFDEPPLRIPADINLFSGIRQS